MNNNLVGSAAAPWFGINSVIYGFPCDLRSIKSVKLVSSLREFRQMLILPVAFLFLTAVFASAGCTRKINRCELNTADKYRSPLQAVLPEICYGTVVCEWVTCGCFFGKFSWMKLLYNDVFYVCVFLCMTFLSVIFYIFGSHQAHSRYSRNLRIIYVQL